MKKQDNILHKNKKAYHDYEILEEHECGIDLMGAEVKSIKARNCNLKGAFVVIRNGEAFVSGMHVSHYKFAQDKIDPYRERKIFLHKKKIIKLEQKGKETGYTLVPTSLYLKGGLIKISIGLAKGKKKYDKREALKKRDIERDKAREMARY